ncbi:MAG: arylsulfatase [Acidimicrobiales bacterium]
MGDSRDDRQLTVSGFALSPPAEPRPADGSPNVVAIVLDDTGFAQLGSFGSDVATPHMDRLAEGGLRYNRFHVTSLCSPTRASFLTGRNHHAVAMGFLADVPLAYPGYSARIPRSAATLPRVLRDAGYSTLAVGKWHLTPRSMRSAAGPFNLWPLGLGFERFYGFLQGSTNHWAPNLIEDNHYLDPGPTPGPDYHLSEDLAATARRQLLDHQHAAPGRPFFLYFALGATHAPHHVAPEWIEPYRGRFDKGWDAWREEVFERQLASGLVPEGTVLTERPSWVAAWADLSADERRLFGRQQEVFAGFLTHADAQIGKVLGTLDELGQLANTIVLVFSDNGASAEGGQLGSPNEHRFSARVRDSLAENLSLIDEWGGPRTYNHYSWGWAWAGNTPHRLWKRYTWLGGTRTPLIVHWPAAIAARGEIRSQFAHVIDLAPTVLEAVGITAPDEVDGVPQQRIDGVSLFETFTEARAPERHRSQYFEMLGSRSIYDEGWKATTNHISTGIMDEEALAIGSRRFEDDQWELFNLDEDFSESTDRAAEEPEVLERLRQRWLAEAEANQVLPIDDTLANRLGALIANPYPAGTRQTYRSGAGAIADESLPLLFGGFGLFADVTVPPAGAAGVLCALGDWNGGFALVVIDGRLAFAFSRAGEMVEVEAEVPVPEGAQSLGVRYATNGLAGSFELFHDDEAVGRTEFDGGMPLTFQHGGAGLRIGEDAGLAVTERYTTPFPWTGEIRSVTFEVPDLGAPPLDEEVRGALHGD